MADIGTIIKEYRDYAEKNGFRLNPDLEIVESVITGLLKSEEKYGKRYCPCRRVTGKSEEDLAKVCPCAWHKEEIKERGACLCQLFVK